MDGAALSERSDLLWWQDLVGHMLFSPAVHLGHDGESVFPYSVSEYSVFGGTTG